MSTESNAAILVVIPAYNEAATITTAVSNAKCVGDVLVVDDGSSDNTAQIACAAGAKVISLPGNQGYEGALSRGMQIAIERDYAFTLTMDADGQHSLQSAQVLIAAVKEADIVIGVRQKKQRAAEWVAGWIGLTLWGVPDPFSGLKLYRIASCKRLGRFDSRLLVGAEMLVRAHRQGLTLATVPIKTSERLDAPRFGSTLRANFRIVRAIFLMIAISWGML